MTEFNFRVLRNSIEGICTTNEAALLQHIEHLETLLQDALKEGGHIDVNSTPIGELREENARLTEKITELEATSGRTLRWEDLVAERNRHLGRR